MNAKKKSPHYPLKSPYCYKQEKYFNWAAGIRATDKYHRVAQDYFLRIKKHEEKGKLGVIAREGLEISENVRSQVADMLNCDPTRVYFSTSATGARLYASAALVSSFELNRIHFSLTQFDQYVSTSSEVSLLMKSIIPAGAFEKMITRPNFPVRNLDTTSLLDCFGAMLRNQRWRKISRDKRSPAGFESTLMRGKFNPMGATASINSYEHSHRNSGSIISNIPVRYGYGKMNSNFYLFFDASHTFGLVGIDIDKTCDLYYAGSSKSLGGEPVLGIGVATSELLSNMLTARQDNILPTLGFQFSPKIDPRQNAKDILSMNHWINLPALVSLHQALLDYRSIGMSKIISILEEKQRYLCTKFAKEIPLTYPKFADDRSRYFYDVTSCFANLNNIKGHPDYMQPLPNTVIWQINLKEEVNKKNALKMITDQYAVTDVHSMPNIDVFLLDNRDLCHDGDIVIRISFRHDVDQDFDGLVKLLGEVNEKYGVK